MFNDLKSKNKYNDIKTVKLQICSIAKKDVMAIYKENKDCNIMRCIQ